MTIILKSNKKKKKKKKKKQHPDLEIVRSEICIDIDLDARDQISKTGYTMYHKEYTHIEKW